jgi:hypothetical protein
MKTFSDFTKSSKQAIQESLFRVRRQAVGDFYGEERGVQQAPEIVLVKIPRDGIPPMVLSVPDDASYATKYTMGMAECDVMYLERDFSEFNDEDETPGSSEISFLDNVDVFALPIKSPVTPFPAFKEKIYNPYPWRAFGETIAFTDPETEVTSSENPFMFTLAVRDRSGFFICTRPPDLLKAKAEASIAQGDSGDVRIYLAGDDLGPLETAYNNWGNAGTIAADEEGYIKFFEDERKWVFMKTSSGGSSAPDGIYYILGDNDDAENAPPYGVLWNSGDGLVDVLGVKFLSLARPFDSFDIHWYVNREDTVSIGFIGVCDTLIEKPGPVLIDPSLEGTVNLGDVLGPKPGGGYYLYKGYHGFTACGQDYLIGSTPVAKCVQHPTLRVFGRMYQEVTQNANGNITGELEIWRRDTDGKKKTAGWTEKLTVYFPLLNKNEKVKQGTFAFADYSTYKWEADPACDRDDTNASQSASPGADINGDAWLQPLPGDVPSGDVQNVQNGVIN